MSSSKKKTHYLFFCPSGIYGGVERYIESRAAELVDSGSNVTLFFLNDGRFFDKIKDNEKLNQKMSPVKVRLKNPISWLIFQFYFTMYLFRKDVEVAQFAMPYSLIFGSIPAMLNGIYIEWFQHGPIGGSLDRLASYFPVDKILFNSKYTKEQHLARVGVPKCENEIYKIEISVDVDHVLVETIKEQYSDTELLFVCAGRITRWKGFENAISALDEVNSKGLKSFKLLIIGEGSTDDDLRYVGELRDLAMSSKIADQVEFLGFQESVLSYVAASNALIHSATQPEPFGLVVAEAIKLNTYVFAPDIGGVKEQLLEAVDKGSLFDHQKPIADLAQKILSKYKK